MTAVVAHLIAFRTVERDEFLEGCVLTTAACSCWGFSNGFCDIEQMMADVCFDFRLWEWCVHSRPNAAGEEISDNWFNEESGVTDVGGLL